MKLMLMISLYSLWGLFVSIIMHIPTCTTPYSVIPLDMNIINNDSL